MQKNAREGLMVDFTEFVQIEDIKAGIDSLAARMPEIGRIAMCFVPPFGEREDLQYFPITRGPAPICDKMQQSTICVPSDKRWICKARDERSALIYSCPAGLTEFVIPLFWKRKWLGTVMGGQIVPTPEENSWSTFEKTVRDLNLDAKCVRAQMLSMPERQLKILMGFLELWLSSLLADKALDWFMRNVERRVPRKDAEQAFSTMVDLLTVLVGASACSIFVYDDESARLVLRATTSSSKRVREAVGEPARGYDPEQIERRGLTGWVFKFQYPLLVHSVKDEGELEELGRLLEQLGFSERPTWLGLLKETSPGQFMGVAMAHGVIRISEPVESDVQLTYRDRDLLNVAAHYLDVVVEDVLVRGRTAVLEMGQALATCRSVTKLLKSVVQIATERFDCATTQVCLIDKEHNELVVEVVYKVEGIGGKRYDLASGGIAVHVAKTGKIVRHENAKDLPFFSGKYDDELRPLLEDVGLSCGTSVLCVPIQGAAEILGTIKLIGKKHRKGFSFEDEIAIKALSRIVGVAIEHVRIQDITHINEMIFRRASLSNLHEASDVVIETAMQMLPNSSIGHLVIAEEAGKGMCIEAYRPPEISKEIDRLNEGFHNMRGIVYDVITRGKPFCGNITDARKQGRLYIECQPGIQSEMTVPLIIGDRTIGAINVESHELDNFREEDLGRLQLLAGYAAVVIHSSRILQSLLESVTALNTGDTVQEILKSVSDGAARLLDVDWVFITILDEQGAHLTTLYSRGMGKGVGTAHAQYCVDKSLPGQVVTLNEPVRQLGNQETMPPCGSYIGVPMIDRVGRMLGVLNACSPCGDTRTFAQCEVDFLSILAGYAATAIETAEHMDELERLRRINIDMAGTATLGEMLSVLYQHLQKLGIQSCTIRMLDSEGDSLNKIGGFGPYSEYAKQKLSIAEDRDAASVQAYLTRKYVVQSKEDAMFIKRFASQLKDEGTQALSSVETIASFPILFNGDIIGVVGVQAVQKEFFDRLTLGQIQSFVQGIPVVFKNIMLAELNCGLARSAVHSLRRLHVMLSKILDGDADNGEPASDTLS
jgi:GAF domain-containing protein